MEVSTNDASSWIGSSSECDHPRSGAVLQWPHLGWHPLADHHAWVVDRHGRLTRMGMPRHRCLHRLQLCSRSPGTYLCGIGYSPTAGEGNSLKFAIAGREISRLPLPPPGRRRRPHLGTSPGPCAAPPPILPLPCLCAQRIYERRLRRGSRCLLECPLFRVRYALLPTAALPAALLLLLQLCRQVPPRRSGLSGSVRRPMRGRGFLCRDQQPAPDRLGARLSSPGCRAQERSLLWYPARDATRQPLR